MKLAIIGTGKVGGTLGFRWAEAGHQVLFGVRDLQSPRVRALAASGRANISFGLIAEAVAAMPIVVLAVPWAAVRSALGVAGNLEGKILIDCTNPIKEGLAGLSIGPSKSAAEQIAAWAPKSRIVKAFSTTGAKNMANPLYGKDPITMFVCGDDSEAKGIVGQLAEDLGFEVVDTGALSTARYLEPLAMLWVHLAYARELGPDFAFKILYRKKRKDPA